MSLQALHDHLAGRPPIRVLYTDVDGTLTGPGGSLLTGADGRPLLEAARALCDAAAAGLAVVPVSGRRRAQLALEARILGLHDFIGEVGSVIVRDGEPTYFWGDCPRGLGGTPHDALLAAGAVDALLGAFAGDLRLYAPWHEGREGGHLFHGLVDVAEADRVLAEAGVDWAYLVDNGRTGGWPGRSVRAYHLLPRGVSKQAAVAEDLHGRGLAPEEAVAVGDSPQDLTMAAVTGTYVQVANGHSDEPDPPAHAFTVPGAMGAGFAQAVDAVLACRAT